MISVFSKVLKDSLTNNDDYYDPARVFGYLTSFLGVLAYLIFSGYAIYKSGEMNYMEWGTGFGLVSSTIIAAAFGVKIKQSSEGDGTMNNEVKPSSEKDTPAN